MNIETLTMQVIRCLIIAILISSQDITGKIIFSFYNRFSGRFTFEIKYTFTNFLIHDNNIFESE